MPHSRCRSFYEIKFAFRSQKPTQSTPLAYFTLCCCFHNRIVTSARQEPVPRKGILKNLKSISNRRNNLQEGCYFCFVTVGRSDTNRIFDLTCKASLLNFIVDITYCQVPTFSDNTPIGFVTSCL